MEVDIDQGSFSESGSNSNVADNMFFDSDQHRKHKLDHHGMIQGPEKRARFERTADMLARSGLLDITMKTAELLRSNQQARQDLVNLKMEINQFMESVLSNPENQDPNLRFARNTFSANPLNMEEIPESPKVSVIKSHSTMMGP